MAALNASVQQARESRGEPTGEAQVHELPEPERKAAKKQTAAKKTAGRRPRSA
ncbi:hypothetical protein ACWDFL_36590 [Streptomyces bungoensis]